MVGPLYLEDFLHLAQVGTFGGEITAISEFYNLSRIVDVELRSSEFSCFVDTDDLGICRSIALLLNVEYLGMEASSSSGY